MTGGAIYSLHAATLQYSTINAYIGNQAHVSINAVVTSEPKITESQVYGSRLRGSKLSFLARTSSLKINDKNYKVRVPIRVLANSKTSLITGDELEIVGILIKTPEKRVAGTLIVSGEVKKRSEANKTMRFLAKIRSDFRNQFSSFGDNAGALVPGMIIGDTSLQNSQFTHQMRRAGLSHLTAVSGANFAIVSSLVFFLCRRIIPAIIPRLIVTSAFLVLFLLLVRPSPSVLRAGVMAAVVLAARASGNSQNSVAALATAISVLILIDPFQGLDPGFILSVLATSGLIFIAPTLTQRFSRHIPESAAEMIAVPCAATLACTPYLLALSGEISALSVLFNVLVAPVVAPITILGFLSLLLMPIANLSSLLIWPAHKCALWITTVAPWSERSPSLAINPLFFLVCLFLGYTLISHCGPRSGIFIVALTIGVISLPRLTFPGSDWKIVQCDVGQGDALVLNIGAGNGILFDAGPDPHLLTNCLLRIGIKKLPLVLISHGHADHYFGAQGLSKRFEIGTIWSNGSSQVANVFNREIQEVSQGSTAVIDDVRIEILWPRYKNESFQSLGGDGSAENNRSVVALVTWAGVKIMVTGDIEPEVQAAISRDYDLSNVDILKVPHHGSRFQDLVFLNEVSPEIALVSVGVGNSYGHPNLELLTSLTNMGSRVFRTDEDGPISVAWRFDDSAARYIFATQAMRKEWWSIQWR